jgi:hypothetical protein
VAKEVRIMRLDIVPLESEKRILVGEGLRLRFKVVDLVKDRSPGSVGDLWVLVMQATGTWQKQGWAQPLGGGVYEVAFPVPKAEVYYVFFACPASGMGFAQFPHLIVQAQDKEVSAFSKPAEPSPTAYQC